MDLCRCCGLIVNAPEAFADPDFLHWLSDETRKFTWYRGGDIDEWSDVVVLVDPSLNGEGSDSSMPEGWWNFIIELCRTHLGSHTGEPHYMVRLTNLTL